MSTDMVPVSGAAAPFGAANASGAMVIPSMDIIGGGGGGGEMWRMSNKRGIYINPRTNEERTELIIRLAHGHTERALFDRKGDEGLLCSSRDAETSVSGIVCRSCPHIAQAKLYDAWHSQNNRPLTRKHEGDCSLRYIIEWEEEFVNTQEGRIHVRHEGGRVHVSVPQTSIYAMFGSSGVITKLQQQKVDVTTVVLRLSIATRISERKEEYFYTAVEVLGPYEEYARGAVRQIVSKIEENPAPVGGLPQTAGGPLPQTAGAPAAAPYQAPAPANTYPAPATTTAAGPASAQPGFGQPAAQPQPPLQRQAAPGLAPAFAQAARNSLKVRLERLPPEMRPVFLDVMKVRSLEELPEGALTEAAKAMTEAESFAPPAR